MLHSRYVLRTESLQNYQLLSLQAVGWICFLLTLSWWSLQGFEKHLVSSLSDCERSRVKRDAWICFPAFKCNSLCAFGISIEPWLFPSGMKMLR